MLIQPFRRWSARRQLARLTPEQAAEALRILIGSKIRTDKRLMQAIALKAAAGAEGAGRTILEKIAAIYGEGREVQFGTGTMLQEGETPEMVLDVESAFTRISKEQ
jgi:hypothetical protein